jgi:hypothetical protein
MSGRLISTATVRAPTVTAVMADVMALDSTEDLHLNRLVQVRLGSRELTRWRHAARASGQHLSDLVRSSVRQQLLLRDLGALARRGTLD